MRGKLAAGLVMVVTMSACGPAPAVCDPTSAREAIRRADLAMAAAVAAHDRERFLTFVRSDGVFFGATPSRGPEQVARAWQALLTPGGPTLDWKPEEVVVSMSCDLAYSTGPYESVQTTGDGLKESATGTYVTIWRRDETDGAWRVAIDIGTPPAPKKD